METVRTIADLRAHVAHWRAAGQSIALVPTMGALHAGHMSLVERAHAMADRVCVTLFVNPTQFGENEDLGSYPRNEARDCEMLVAADVDLLYAPGVGEMYGHGDVTRVMVGDLAECLEGAHRSGFFTGVATIVTKLLLQALPDVALFGEKDFQQLQVIKRMGADLCIPVSIEGVPTVREADGLALSSRNAYLNATERAAAPILYEALNDIADAVRGGGKADEAVSRAKVKLTDAGFSSVDYISLRETETFGAVSNLDELGQRSGRVLGAAQLGRTRLIDNIAL